MGIRRNPVQVTSLSQQRIDQLKELRDKKEQGILSGIPLWDYFPSLGKTVPTIDKGQVILNAAASGVGSYINQMLYI